jgi:hypothetical protein
MKRPFGRAGHRREDNIMMDLKEMVKVWDQIELAQNRVQ